MERKALICLEKCLEIDQNNAFKNEILHLMVHANFRLNNCDISIDLLKRMIADAPSLNYINGLGELYIKTQKYNDFVEYLENFSKENKTDIKTMPLDIVSKYGECLYMAGKKNKSEEYFKIILD